MGIRIQPREVVIPDDDPFRNDLLDRKEKSEVLTSLVSNIDGPCTMAVDAAWGAGKTTFLKMWAQHLRIEKFPVVEFNAWETDASGDPFVALTTEITGQLKGTADSTRLDQVSSQAKELIRKLAPGLIRFGTSFVPIAGAEMGHTFSALAEEALSSHQEAKQSSKQFNDSLQELADTLWDPKARKPIVVLIDELDRCRPTYAIELLETTKHIFSVDRVVFVLAVNRAELAHSVKALYGSEFDAEGYLRRFFDLDFRLPAPDRQAFIQNTLTLNGVHDFLYDSPDQFAKSQLALDALTIFLAQSELTLRDIGQSIHRLSVVLLSLEKNEHVYFRTLSVLAVISATNPSLYRQFIEERASAEDTIESLFRQPPFVGRRNSAEGTLVESVIMAARISARDFGPASTLGERQSRYPQYSYYANIVESARSADGFATEESIHARNICESVASFHLSAFNRNEPLGFEETVQRFELLSPDLKETAS